MKDDQEQVLEAHASPLRGRDGELAGGLVVLDDLTQLQRLERVRTDFVANVSHELKTPVTAISGLVETLIESEEMDEETRSRFLGKIQNQSLRLSSLVADLLALSRVEARDEQQLELRRMDLKLTAMDSVRRAMVAAESSADSPISQTATRACSSANNSATARPMPLPPPVTRIIYPSNRFWFIIHSCR